jgi:hypothetical protein
VGLLMNIEEMYWREQHSRVDAQLCKYERMFDALKSIIKHDPANRRYVMWERDIMLADRELIEWVTKTS